MTIPKREVGDMCLSVNGTIISENCSKGEVKREYQTEDATGMHAEDEQIERTLRKSSIPATIFYNFGEGSIEELLNEVFEEGTAEIIFKPKKGKISKENPGFRMKDGLLTSLTVPVPGPRKLIAQSVEFMNKGTTGVERLTEPISAEEGEL